MNFTEFPFYQKKTRKRFRINSGSRSKLQKYRENQRPCNPNIPEIVQKVPKSWILRNFLFTKKKHGNDSGSIPDQGQNCKSIGKIKDLAIPIHQKSSKRSQNHEFYGISFLPKKSRKRFRINSGSRSKLQKYRENQRPCNPNISEIVQKVPKSWFLWNFQLKNQKFTLGKLNDVKST